MVDKDTQTRQRLLKAKIVKFGHGGNYIKDPYYAQWGEDTITITNTVIATSRRESQQKGKH